MVLAVEIGDLREEPLQAEPLPEDVHVRAELDRSEIGQFGDVVDGRGVKLGMQPRFAEVGLEDAKATVVLLPNCILLPKLCLEAREVMLHVQQVVGNGGN